MKRRTQFAAALALAASLALPASAEELKVFEMADGRIYHPASGLTADSMEKLQALLGSSAPVEAVASSPVPPAAPAAGRLQLAVERARTMLRERIAATKPAKPTVVTSYDVWVDVTLALWNERTDEIRLVQVRKNGTKLDYDAAGLDIGVKKHNGVNSEFVLDDGGEHAVVAVQYPIFKDVSVSSRKPRYELQDVVYTPYAKRIHTPELVAWGETTLRSAIVGATYDLRAAGIRSRAYPDRLLADVIDPRLAEAIVIVEHLGEMALLGENGRLAMESVYVTLATNQRDAYAYSRSSAGARGLVQFIPSTYALMTKRKELGLTKDFDSGMTDPINAIKAEIAYLDAELAGMPAEVKEAYLRDPLKTGEILAAAYNGGGTRVKRALKLWGDRWAEAGDDDIAELKRQHVKADALIEKLKKSGPKAELAKAQRDHDAIVAKQSAAKNGTLRRETSMYVKKLVRTYELLYGVAPVTASGT